MFRNNEKMKITSSSGIYKAIYYNGTHLLLFVDRLSFGFSYNFPYFQIGTGSTC